MAFVGRERELAQLVEAVRRVAEGRHGHVVLTGPAGMGCTRLLDELSRRVASVPGVSVYRGRCFPPAAGVPYYPLAEALTEAFARVPDARLAAIVQDAGHDLGALVPSLVARLDGLGIGREPPVLVAPDQLGRRVVESILGVLERLAGDGVLVLVLEDIHDADPATRNLIEALGAVGRSLPVSLVVTYQADELHRRHPLLALADRLAGDREIVKVALGPLPARRIEQLVIEALGERPPANVMTAVVEGAHGNPLLAVQLALSAGSLEGVRLSDPFEQLCGARLEAMSRDGARVVRVMAAAHVPLPRSTLLAIGPPDGRLTVVGLEEALRSGFVGETRGALAMTHELCAEAIEALELTPERQAIHAAIAARLEGTPALAAWHWSRAARPTEARSAAIAAARAVCRLDPAHTTLLHYEEALELPALERASTEEQAAFLAGAAHASAAAGSFRRAVALMRRAIESRATRDADPRRGQRDAGARLALGEMHEELGRFQWAGGDLVAAVASMERALAIIPDSPSRARARAQASLAQHLMIDGRFEASATLARAAIATATVASEQGDEALAERGHATCTLGVDVAYLGDLEGGLRLLADAADLARAAGRLDDLMRVAANRTTLLDLDARRDEALAVVQASLADARAGGLAASYGAFLRGNAADILFHLGRWQEAEAECRIAMDWRMGALEAEWWPPLVLGLVITESRADEEAASLVGKALLQLETVPAGQWTALVLRSAVSLALWSSDAPGALAIAEREWPRALGSAELGVVAPAAATCLEAAAAAADHGRSTNDAGIIARAHALAATVLPDAEAQVGRSSLGPKLGARHEAELHLATARAHAARVRGRADEQAWDRLATDWGARSMPYRQAKARWWQALAILAAAREDEREAARARAREPLSEAYRIARDLPALPLLREIVDLAARARVNLAIAAGDPYRRIIRGRQRAPMAPASGRAPIAVGPGPGNPAVAVGPGRPASPVAASGPDIARAIEERVLAALRDGPSDTYGLSPREREVLNILAEGRTDRDIAGRLFISERTVHVHVRRILAKLGVSSRTEAAGVAIRQGLVPAVQPRGAGSSPGDDVASPT